jgi:hypothetical protein
MHCLETPEERRGLGFETADEIQGRRHSQLCPVNNGRKAKYRENEDDNNNKNTAVQIQRCRAAATEKPAAPSSGLTGWLGPREKNPLNPIVSCLLHCERLKTLNATEPWSTPTQLHHTLQGHQHTCPTTPRWNPPSVRCRREAVRQDLVPTNQGGKSCPNPTGTRV